MGVYSNKSDAKMRQTELSKTLLAAHKGYTLTNRGGENNLTVEDFNGGYRIELQTIEVDKRNLLMDCDNNFYYEGSKIK